MIAELKKMIDIDVPTAFETFTSDLSSDKSKAYSFYFEWSSAIKAQEAY